MGLDFNYYKFITPSNSTSVYGNYQEKKHHLQLNHNPENNLTLINRQFLESLGYHVTSKSTNIRHLSDATVRKLNSKV